MTQPHGTLTARHADGRASRTDFGWLSHGLFWGGGGVVIGLGLLVSYRGEWPGLAEFALRLVWHLSCIAVVVYLNLRVLIPRYFAARRYLTFAALLVGALAVCAAVILSGYVIARSWLAGAALTRSFQPHVFVVFFIHGSLLVLASSLLHFAREWMRLRDRSLAQKDLERRQMEAELLTLRAQLNPHFLFNTLNNIYALSLEGSPKASAYILKLSELMRYFLYDTKGYSVPLAKEVEFLGHYLKMEQLRLSSGADVRLSVEGTMNDVRVPPLLLAPLVENAFKHGAANRIEKEGDEAFVHIDIRCCEDGRLSVTIENDREERPLGAAAPSTGPYQGVGLANTRRRLALLYPQRHRFAITDMPHRFKIELELDPEFDAHHFSLRLGSASGAPAARTHTPSLR